MTSQKKFDKFVLQRVGLLRALNESASDLDAALLLTDISSDLLEDFYLNLGKSYQNFQENQMEISSIGILEIDDDLLAEHEKLSGDARLCYMSAVQKYAIMKKTLDSATVTTSPVVHEQIPRSKLENIPTPEWSGTRSSYASWKGQFIRAMVKHHQDDDDQLSRVKKAINDSNHVWKNRVKNCNSIADVWQLLDIEFGNKEKLIEEIYQEIKQFKLKSQDSRGLADFASAISDFIRNISNAGESHESKSRLFISELRGKLSSENQKAFSTSMMDKEKDESAENLVNWLRRESLLLSRSEPKFTGRAYAKETIPNVTSGTNSYGSRFSNRNVFLTQDVKGTECLVCQKSHDTRECFILSAKPQRVRVQSVKNSGGCFCCFKKGHRNVECVEESTCVGKDCRWKTPHHRLLCTIPDVTVNMTEEAAACAQPDTYLHGDHDTSNLECIDEQGMLSYHVSGRNCDVFMNVIAISLLHPSGQLYSTYALLDPCANVDVVSSGLMEKFKFECKKEQSARHIGTVTGTAANSIQTSCESMIIRGIHQDAKKHELKNLIVLPCEHFSKIRCPNAIDAEKFPIITKAVHISRVDYPHVSMIISMKNWKLHEPLACETIQNGPSVIKTPLGYVVMGPCDVQIVKNTGDTQENICNNILELKQIADRLYQIDDVQNLFSKDKMASVEEQKAQIIMEDSVERIEGEQVQVKTPYKDDECLPDNFNQAESCLEAQRKVFLKNPEYFDEYSGKMKEHKIKHADKVPPTDVVIKRRFFLIPHGVRHRRKKTLRIVWNLSKLFKGVSLNGRVMSCPDLLNKMIGLLIRFRELKVAIVGDIQGFYLAVLTPKEDWDLARFLWFENDDVNGRIEQYRMKVHMFGGIASQAAAIIALQRVINDAANDGTISQSAASEFIRSFYSDDHLSSHDDVETAVQSTEKLASVLKSGKFILTKYCSNRPEVVEALGCEQEDGLVDMLSDIETTALGMIWNASKDCLLFQYECPEIPNSPREALSALMRLFDLLGLVAPYTLPLKKAVRGIVCSEKLWDDKLDDEERKELELCLKSLQNLHMLEIPRHVGGESDNSSVRQLHVFADGSEHCYGACAYLRTVKSNGTISSSLLMSKSKLTPQRKMLTIPKIELSSNVIGVRISKIIRDEVKLPFHQTFFWTDSMCVLDMIRNETKRFPRFIGNRLAEINALSNVSQFGYVESCSNPADILSRGRHFDIIRNVDNRWMTGAPFLLEPESNWPKQPRLENFTAAAALVVNLVQVQSIAKWYTKLNTWFRLQYHAAIIRRFRNILLSRVRVRNGLPALELPKGNVTISELREAGRYVLICYQRDAFPEEFDCVMKNKPVPLDSSLRCLNPVVRDGLLCVGGRLKHAKNVPLSQKYPIILPTSGHITELLVNLSHSISGHGSVNMVLTELRLRYWVINPRRSIRNIVQKCISCGRYSARVGEQIMADLPNDRIQMHVKPFLHCGVDLFGHFFTKRARSDLKRWVALYTCLTTRCCHLEVLESLDMDDFLESYRMFVVRRGVPETLRSDQGTNFVAADAEIKLALDKWNNSGLAHELLQKGTDWLFNVPKGSHFGGAWESLIRLARKALRHTLFDKTISDRSFRTLICEVEGILNSRPLTQFSCEPDDLRPITPYDILLLRPNVLYPPGVFTNEDSYLLKSYKAAQHHANTFWVRYRQEYLPKLQERSKWVTTRRDFKIHDLVLLVDDKAKRGQWKVGRIIEVYRSEDDHVRSVRIKCVMGEYDRPIDKICLLEATAL